jgi:hypothetical protein
VSERCPTLLSEHTPSLVARVRHTFCASLDMSVTTRPVDSLCIAALLRRRHFLCGRCVGV